MASEVESKAAAVPAPKRGVSGLIESAFSAAINALVVLLLGRIALTIVSGVASSMTPSAPPGVEWTHFVPRGGVMWELLSSARFQIIYGLVFLVCFWAELAKRSYIGGTATGNSRWQRIGERVAEHWFGSVIGNAFVAMGLAIALQVISNFTVWHWVWSLVTNFFSWLLGDATESGWMSRVKVWWEWYDENQLKFNFWLIYLAAVCDDFGIPNLKTLARWLWRRWRTPKAAAN